LKNRAHQCLEVVFVFGEKLRRGAEQFIVGALVEKRFERLRLFVNAENLGNIR